MTALVSNGVPPWQPGTSYIPGYMVTPRSNNVVTQVQPNNNSFETGLTHWTVTSAQGGGAIAAVSASGVDVFDGTQSALFAGFTGPGTRQSSTVLLSNDFMAPVVPGQTINFSCMIRYDVGATPGAAFANGRCGIAWYTAGSVLISTFFATNPPPNGTPGYLSQVGGTWAKSSGTGVAPAGAAFAQAVIQLNNNTGGSSVFADLYIWDYTEQGYPPGLVFVATQAAAGISGTTEPVWPATAGLTVVDNTVTWTAEFASQLTWQAKSILTAGAVQPIWPTTPGGSVLDNNIIWTAVTGQVTDPNCPQSIVAAIAAGKVFAADGDIIRFCATTNPLDWTTQFDAGFLPFGMQTYGTEPCAALGLYRGNLVALNSLGYQMWQVDPDPANMALLDAQPVGSTFSKSVAPVQNDLVLLTPKGIRSLGISGQSGNVQAGQFGKNIDPLVIASIAGGLTPRGLFYPGTGQYWLCFGSTVYVMTHNGAKATSWSMYTFPSSIDYWTTLNGILYLRSGDLVWQVDEATLLDDVGGNNTPFTGIVQWPFIDFGAIGEDQVLEGVKFVCTGTGKISILYNENDFTQFTAPYAFSGDTLPQMGMLPIPLTAPSFAVQLTFDPNQAWEWDTMVVYEADTTNA